jgi:hypothetical protein
MSMDDGLLLEESRGSSPLDFLQEILVSIGNFVKLKP